MRSEEEANICHEDTEDKVIPKKIASALGRGMEQLVKTRALTIEAYIQILKNSPNVNSNENLDAMRESLRGFKNFFRDLQSSRKIKLVLLQNVAYEVKFIGENITPEEIASFEPDQVTIDQTQRPSLTQIAGAMRHKINNIINPLLGYPEMIEFRTQDEIAKAQTRQLGSHARNMYDTLSPILNAKSQLRILTDAQGKTTIIPDMPSTP